MASFERNCVSHTSHAHTCERVLVLTGSDGLRRGRNQKRKRKEEKGKRKKEKMRRNISKERKQKRGTKKEKAQRKSATWSDVCMRWMVCVCHCVCQWAVWVDTPPPPPPPPPPLSTTPADWLSARSRPWETSLSSHTPHTHTTHTHPHRSPHAPPPSPSPPPSLLLYPSSSSSSTPSLSPRCSLRETSPGRSNTDASRCQWSMSHLSLSHWVSQCLIPSQVPLQMCRMVGRTSSTYLGNSHCIDFVMSTLEIAEMSRRSSPSECGLRSHTWRSDEWARREREEEKKRERMTESFSFQRAQWRCDPNDIGGSTQNTLPLPHPSPLLLLQAPHLTIQKREWKRQKRMKEGKEKLVFQTKSKKQEREREREGEREKEKKRKRGRGVERERERVPAS